VNPNIDAVLFDFAGVLTTSPTKMMGARAAKFSVRLEDFLQIVLGPLDQDTDHPWHQIERGEISRDDFNVYVAQASKDAGLDGFPTLPTGAELETGLTPIPSMIQLAADVRAAGYKTAIVSNNIKEWSTWRSLVDADNLVDEVVDSSDVGMRKPSAGIFRHTLAVLEVADAKRALFLDDFVWNVAGAEDVGLQAMHVQDHVEAEASVRELLGL